MTTPFIGRVWRARRRNHPGGRAQSARARKKNCSKSLSPCLGAGEVWPEQNGIPVRAASDRPRALSTFNYARGQGARPSRMSCGRASQKTCSRRECLRRELLKVIASQIRRTLLSHDFSGERDAFGYVRLLIKSSKVSPISRRPKIQVSPVWAHRKTSLVRLCAAIRQTLSAGA